MSWPDALQFLNALLIPAAALLWRLDRRLQRVERLARAVRSLERRVARLEQALIRRATPHARHNQELTP